MIQRFCQTSEVQLEEATLKGCSMIEQLEHLKEVSKKIPSLEKQVCYIVNL